MEQFSKFSVSLNRLMDLAMELTVLVHSHQGICKWLGPYDETDIEAEDYLAQYYRNYFEERLSYLLVTLACLIRNMDDQKLLSSNLMDRESENIDLAEICREDQWTPVTKFRTVLNFVMHSQKLCPAPETDVEYRDIAGIPLTNTTRFFDGAITLWSREHNRGDLVPINLNLKKFADMVFRAVEELRVDEEGDR